MSRFSYSLLLTLTGLFLAFSPVRAIDLGPIYDRFPLTMKEGTRTEIAGPLVSTQKTPEDSGWAFSPLIAYRRNPGIENSAYDFLYPILTYDRYGTEARFQILQVISWSVGNNQKQENRKMFTVFPVYFQRRAPDPKDNYTAVMPFYGTLQNRLFRDRIHFIMLPLYIETEKHDVRTDNYLLPLIHVRRGNGLKGWQFWPFYGTEHKDITTKTNGFNEVETVPGHDKFFGPWLLNMKNTLGVGTTNVETQQLNLPFYAHTKSPSSELVAYGYPVGFTKIDNKALDYKEWGAPWPIVDFARGPGKTGNRVWPIFGFVKTPEAESDFILLPLYMVKKAHTANLDRNRTRIMFFLYSDTTEKNVTTGKFRRRTTLFPFFTATRDLDGNERLQLFAPLEALIPNNDSIEQLYSPLWSIWRSEKNAKTGAYSESFLWNLYRREETKDRKKVTVLFGLFQYRKDDTGKHFKLFYIPVK